MNDSLLYEKLEISKEDGRYLIYYHFPASADAEQTETFLNVKSAAVAVADTPAAAASAPSTEKESPRV